MNLSVGKTRGITMRVFLPVLFVISLSTLGTTVCRAEEPLNLDDLVAEGLRNNPEILAAQARAQAAGFRIPQAKSLPDPMFMFGYQNEGFQTSPSAVRRTPMPWACPPFPKCSTIRGNGSLREKWQQGMPKASPPCTMKLG